MPGELPAAVPETEGFRALMTRFPTGVTVVTAMDGGGRPQGMTCSSLASVCLRPPTLLVCLRTLSATQRAVEATGAFAVNLLHSGGRTLDFLPYAAAHELTNPAQEARCLAAVAAFAAPWSMRMRPKKRFGTNKAASPPSACSKARAAASDFFWK